MSILQTPRLALRELDFGDGDFILELLNEAGFLRHIGDKGVRSVADARDYILKGPMDSYSKNGFGLYATCLSDGTPIGICGLVRREGLTIRTWAAFERYWSRLCGGIGRRGADSRRKVLIWNTSSPSHPPVTPSRSRYWRKSDSNSPA